MAFSRVNSGICVTPAIALAEWVVPKALLKDPWYCEYTVIQRTQDL